MKSIFFTLGSFVFLQLFCLDTSHSCWAGNKKIVEKKIIEMDILNKKIVKESVPEIPEEGVIQTEAKVFYKKGEIKFEVTGQSVSPVQKKTIDMNSSSLKKQTEKGGEDQNE